MGVFTFNVAKGKVARYADLPGTNDALVLVMLQSTGLETDAVLKDYDTLAAILAGTNAEATFAGYSRITLAGVVSAVDDAADVMRSDANDPGAVTNTGASQAVGAMIVCYDPDTTAGTDADLVPLVSILSSPVTFDTDVPVTIALHASGFFEAA